MSTDTILQKVQIPFKQTSKSGCGSFTLANFFNDSSFIRDIETLEQGEGVYDLNEKLKELAPEFYLESIFITHSQCEIQQNRLHDPLIFETIMEKVSEEQRETWARPFFVTIKGLLRSHYVLVIHNLKDQRLYIFDSLAEGRQSFTISEFLQWFHVMTVEVLCSKEWSVKQRNGGETLYIFKDKFPHLFNEGE